MTVIHGNDDGKEKKRGSHLFPLRIVHRELFFFSLFSLEYQAEAPAKDYVHLLAFTFTIRTFMTVTRRKRQQRGVWGRGGSIHPNIRILVVFLPIFLQSWGILGASIPEWGIENNACRINLPVSQKFSQGFRAALLDALSQQLARSLAICREAGSR